MNPWDLFDVSELTGLAEASNCPHQRGGRRCSWSRGLWVAQTAKYRSGTDIDSAANISFAFSFYSFLQLLQ